MLSFVARMLGLVLFAIGVVSLISDGIASIAARKMPAAARSRTLRLTVQHHPARPSDRLRVPLSYREQWLGSQECFRAYAL